MRLRNAFRKRVFEASNLVLTKTLLLKHYSAVKAPPPKPPFYETALFSPNNNSNVPRKRSREPVRGTDGPMKGTEGPATGTGPLLIARSPLRLLVAPVPVTILIAGVRADL